MLFLGERNEQLNWCLIKRICEKLPIDCLHYHTGLSESKKNRPTE